MSAAIREILEAEGIEVRLEREVHQPVAAGRRTIVARVDCADGAPEVAGTHLLLAVGRRPNTDDLGLEKAGVKVDERGYIEVDDELRTSVPGIWALGDCNGKGAFTHTSYNDAEIVVANLLENDTAPGERSHPGLRAVHRSAARSRRDDGGGGARDAADRRSSASGR